MKRIYKGAQKSNWSHLQLFRCSFNFNMNKIIFVALLLVAAACSQELKAPEDTLEVKAAKEFHKFAHDVEKSRKFAPYYHHENPAVPETPAVYFTKLDHFARKNAEVAYKTGFYPGYPVYPAGYPTGYPVYHY